jgi:hypothetical protein
MNYKTYRILIRFGSGARHIEVVACDLEAAKADVMQAFDGVEIIQAGAVG